MSHDIDPALAGLEPPELWRQFDALRRIPRPSLHEAGVRAHLQALAERGIAPKQLGDALAEGVEVARGEVVKTSRRTRRKLARTAKTTRKELAKAAKQARKDATRSRPVKAAKKSAKRK